MLANKNRAYVLDILGTLMLSLPKRIIYWQWNLC